MGDARFGRYRLQRLLGKGGMGQIWLARDPEGRRVALKLLPPELAADASYRIRFEREAELAAALRDPHLVSIHRHGEVDGRLFIDMEYIEGTDLEARLAAGGPMTAHEAVDILAQVAAALDTAHRAGLVHRDVKPSNILVRPDGFTYLIDFGIAQRAGQTGVTAAGFAIGTCAYMAPERFNGKADARTDVYSLACVLYECLTGQRPYGDADPARQMHAHLMIAPPRASTVDPTITPALDAVIARAMSKEPANRHRSAGEFARAARAAIGHSLGSVAAPAGPPSVAAPAGPPSVPAPAGHPSVFPPTRPPSGAADASPFVASAASDPATAGESERGATEKYPRARRHPGVEVSAGVLDGESGVAGGPRAAADSSTPSDGPPPGSTSAGAPSGIPADDPARVPSPTKIITEAPTPTRVDPRPLPPVRHDPTPAQRYPVDETPGPEPTKVMPAPGPTPTRVETRLDPAAGAALAASYRPVPAVYQPNPYFRPPVRPAPPVPRPYTRRPPAARSQWGAVRWPSRGPVPVAPPRRPAPRRRVPKRRRGGVLRKVIGALVVIFLAPFAFAAGCFALIAGGSSGGSDSARPPAVADENPGSGSGGSGPAPAGAAVRDGKFEFAVTGIESGVGRVGLQSPKGTYLVVTLAVRNISDEKKWFLPFGQKLVDSRSRALDHDTTATAWQTLGHGQGYSFELAPGASGTTQLVFDIPSDATPNHLELHDFVLSDGVSVFLW
ncbi:protein kinase domain-containing protein [Nocardia aurea]|uniref:protein kinase domain-containing protein n=1 Tax=Nocardia aurea TaxID=2144174 RepID=UPI00339E2155